jgi:hypothetical protein
MVIITMCMVIFYSRLEVRGSRPTILLLEKSGVKIRVRVRRRKASGFLL